MRFIYLTLSNVQIPKLNRMPGQPRVVWEHKAKWLKLPSSYWWWFQQCHEQLNSLNTGTPGMRTDIHRSHWGYPTRLVPVAPFPSASSWTQSNTSKHLPSKQRLDMKQFKSTCSEKSVLLYTKVLLYPYDSYLSTVTQKPNPVERLTPMIPSTQQQSLDARDRNVVCYSSTPVFSPTSLVLQVELKNVSKLAGDIQQ